MRAAFPDALIREVAPGWEERWREFHRSVRVGPLWVGPPWESAPAGALAVVIDPGRAFGTGAHATTRLCLELLTDVPRGSLLDAGCGSGVLAIAAARVGFAPVVAVDLDPIAVEATRANAVVNGVSIDVRCLDALDRSLPGVDVVVANLTLAGVEALAPLVDAAYLVASGYLGRDTPRLEGWTSTARRDLDGWAGDVFVRGD